MHNKTSETLSINSWIFRARILLAIFTIKWTRKTHTCNMYYKVKCLHQIANRKMFGNKSHDGKVLYNTLCSMLYARIIHRWYTYLEVRV